MSGSEVKLRDELAVGDADRFEELRRQARGWVETARLAKREELRDAGLPLLRLAST